MNHAPTFRIGNRVIDVNSPTFIIAELSANHNRDFEEAVKLIIESKKAGADAVKLQTYTADTLTIRSDQPTFMIDGGTLWDKTNLHDLYQKAYTPWEWQPKLKEVAEREGLKLFSTPFDKTAVDFLEAMNVEVHKVASFELVDHGLLRTVAKTGKPIIMSTGMATLAEIDEAVAVIRAAGGTQLALLKCTSGYPADPAEMNLHTIPHLSQAFDVVAGLSDHTMGSAAPIAAVALGARIIEKHFTFSRSVRGPDSEFSMEPAEFRDMVNGVRMAEKSLGRVHYGVSEKESKSRVFRRSLYIVEDMKAGEVLTEKNLRSIRPGYGIAPKFLDQLLGKPLLRPCPRGTPMSWDLLSPPQS